ncbi:GH3 auxin-responsive promoter family protein [Oligoflexaceae bacterium]|nr:GH3 auxin-responsive promoter family protein [Oligoflexaceae bacterium]
MKQVFDKFVEQTHAFEKSQSGCRKRIQKLLRDSGYWGPKLDIQQSQISTFEDYRSTIETSFHGKFNPLNGEQIRFWCRSSGTSSKPKLFPITDSYRSEFQTVTLPHLASLESRFPNFLKKKILFIVASAPEEKTDSGIGVGFISHFNYANNPDAQRFVLPIESLQDDATIYQWGPLYALASDLSAIAAITPAVISRFLKILIDRFDEYLAFLEGKCEFPNQLPIPNVTAERLDYLKSLKGVRDLTADVIFPDLRFTACWMSSTAGLQIPHLRSTIGETVQIVDGAYCATEGWMTVPIRNEIGGVLNPAGHLVEFCEEQDADHPTRLLTGSQLEVGQRYEVFLTTSMGLVRYRLRDVVLCAGFFNQAPIISFQYKSGAILCVGQVRFTEAAILDALSRVGIASSHPLAFGPSREGDRLVCYASREKSISKKEVDQLQNMLAKANPEYDDELKSGLQKGIDVKKLAPTDAFWTHVNPTGPQMKRKLLVSDFPFERESS